MVEMSVMVSKTALSVAAGVCGTLFLGYCIYFDRKRRSDPLFKQKLRERRAKAQQQKEQARRGTGKLPDLKDYDAVQKFFIHEVQMGEELLAQGDIENGVEHLSSAVAVCGQPQQLLQVLQQTLPPQVFHLLLQRLPVVSQGKLDSSVLTVVLISLLNAFVSWLQGGIIGLAALLPSDYMHSLVIGMAVGGLFASVMQIICLLGHTDPTTAALAYFLLAIFVFVAALACFLFMLSSVWPQAASALYVMAVSMAVFPAVAVLVVSSERRVGIRVDRFFLPVCGYLLFNAGDLTGRIVCSYLPLNEKHEHTVLWLTLARTVFVPLFMLCNAHPRHYLPVVLDSDVAFIALMTVFAFTNGYLLSASMMQASRKVASYLQEKTGFLMCSAIMTGLTIGGFTSVLLIKLL
ncbi:hypothetical protein HPB51_002016 [Rhipicephalus microplus]|uniref:Uncharacterized protein n=1 Tax=Rhipicephalus microplus TaxID=6941 RepID=A0A9J6DXY0_RHIMP|nr:hypothetical protein HPB51_002016 [Rhipicephalus microplus]